MGVFFGPAKEADPGLRAGFPGARAVPDVAEARGLPNQALSRTENPRANIRLPDDVWQGHLNENKEGRNISGARGCW